MTDKAITIHSSFDEMQSIAQAMAKSGYFADSNDAAKAIVKILAGRELGLGPFASMTGIFIIQGRPSLGANLIGTLIKNDPRYDYRVVELTDQKCSLDFYEQGTKTGNSTFTLDDAKRAGTKNMDKFPRNMLFARAISNGARWFTPGIFGGSPVYTPEELGADVDETGDVIPGSFLERTLVEPTPPSPAAMMTLDEASAIADSKGVLYSTMTHEQLADKSQWITKALNTDRAKTDADHRAELLYKQDAIRVLLQQPPAS